MFMKKDYFWGFMCAFVLAFTLVCITHCDSKPVPACPALSGTIAERDSMIACLKEFDDVFSLADTVCEDEDGEMAIDNFESYVSKDTVDIKVARSLYQAVAKEIEFVTHLQLDSDEDSDASLFDGRWHEFNMRYINLKLRISLREQLDCYVICYHHGEQLVQLAAVTFTFCHCNYRSMACESCTPLLSHGVMVAQQILVLFVEVRILMRQQLS